ncbi:ABC transporter substrate-binding protein [Rhodococcus sp. PAMC28707]|uniref:ABC transporter substrate-binding protein n=1 Tax=unclassified Rhodococcus (in: high G+C Gram-positive bacteria) TaxID=192944 RepID=UPI00109E0EBA|nr:MULTISPECIES: ABC transporter substrate-binding protein [unclassified Rhodococcus (in: high G+C Gram-positive bacteria)]QCB51366.1 ABC transporter substrate-binding protein [Rhodococcus sp. PAMC28705]QCB60466.1 ABC transporter substrate-binding protein [Rhodococcus sp. PAMC28707]
MFARSYSRPARIILALSGAGALLLTACAQNTEDGGAPAADEKAAVEITEVAEVAATLPQKNQDSGMLVVGVNVPYSPNEFKDASGKIIGFDVDLMDAVAGVLGVTAQYEEADFDRIIPSVQAGTYDLGMSSFTDTKERENSVDFTTYFNAGTQWAQQAGGKVDPTDACGLKVAVQTTTIQDQEEVPAKSAACVAAGKPAIDILKFDSQDDAANALVLGRVDAMSADSPVTAYAIKQTGDKLEAAGEVFDSAPYGYPVAKGSPLAASLQQAVQYLIDNGQYQTIAENWGVEAGVIKEAKINGAVS